LKKTKGDKLIGERSWREVQIEIHPSLGEVVAAFLIDQGSPGVRQEEVTKVSPAEKERIIGYFLNDRSWRPKKEIIQDYLTSLGDSQSNFFPWRSKIIKEEKWAEAWKSNFKPLLVSPRIVVKPPWEEYAVQKGQVIIEIDPGMAFGTGTHPSTQMCLQVLDEMIPSFPGHPSVLDVGTGSGILAIAACKLGAKRVVAIDTDPVAVNSARKNAAANKIKKGIQFRLGSLDRLRPGFDIVVANLLPQELLSLSSSLAEKILPDGVLILSGFLQKQKKEVMNVFTSHALKVRRTQKSKGWACCVLSYQEGK
jgi:ribosomal protein L11 methyltransferase